MNLGKERGGFMIPRWQDTSVDEGFLSFFFRPISIYLFLF